jgi:hypothetical protein
MNTRWLILAILWGAFTLPQQAVSQNPPLSPFLSGSTTADPNRFSSTSPADSDLHLNHIWLYVDTKADEIEATGVFTHVLHQLDNAAESQLAQLIVEYADKFYDHDINLRIQRMCTAYETGLQTMDPERSATLALQHLETGEQLRARRSAIADQFVAAVAVDIGATYAEMVVSEAELQANTVAAYSIATTRDWIEAHDLNKIGYMKNACGI